MKAGADSPDALTRLSELLRRRNQAQIELLRASTEVDACLAALAIRAREASALGSGLDVPMRPTVPPIVRKYLG